jgi:hypothetical protein
MRLKLSLALIRETLAKATPCGVLFTRPRTSSSIDKKGLAAMRRGGRSRKGGVMTTILEIGGYTTNLSSKILLKEYPKGCA